MYIYILYGTRVNFNAHDLNNACKKLFHWNEVLTQTDLTQTLFLRIKITFFFKYIYLIYSLIYIIVFNYNLKLQDCDKNCRGRAIFSVTKSTVAKYKKVNFIKYHKYV